MQLTPGCPYLWCSSSSSFQVRKKSILKSWLVWGAVLMNQMNSPTYPFSTELEILIFFDGFKTIIVMIITV